MITLGLTGSIGMGKSTAAKMLRTLGVPVHDSDAAVHAALRSDSPYAAQIARTFPEAWDAQKKTIRRDVLSRIIFADVQQKKRLEDILHPAVWADQKRFRMKHQRMGAAQIAFDIPLLFETGAQQKLDYTIVVSAPYPIQKRRVMARAGMTEARFLTILHSQMPDAEKRVRADFVIPTGQGAATTFRALKNVLHSLS